MRLILALLVVFLSGCGNTPKQDDYVKYVNKLNLKEISRTGVKFRFNSTNVELRGKHSNDSLIDASPILYQGGAGLAGLALQIGAHSSIVSSQRQEKLKQVQDQANEAVQPFIDVSNSLQMDDLLGEYAGQVTTEVDYAANTFDVNAIFFSSQDMTTLSLKTIVWQKQKTSKKKKSKKTKFSYNNLVQVFSTKLTDDEKNKIVAGDKALLVNKMSSLLQRAMTIANNDLLGKYSLSKNPAETFFINDNNKKKVLRGKVVEEFCNYKVIQNLHYWFIAFPTEPQAAEPNVIQQCSS